MSDLELALNLARELRGGGRSRFVRLDGLAQLFGVSATNPADLRRVREALEAAGVAMEAAPAEPDRAPSAMLSLADRPRVAPPPETIPPAARREPRGTRRSRLGRTRPEAVTATAARAAPSETGPAERSPGTPPPLSLPGSGRDSTRPSPGAEPLPEHPHEQRAPVRQPAPDSSQQERAQEPQAPEDRDAGPHPGLDALAHGPDFHAAEDAYEEDEWPGERAAGLGGPEQDEEPAFAAAEGRYVAVEGEPAPEREAGLDADRETQTAAASAGPQRAAQPAFASTAVDQSFVAAEPRPPPAGAHSAPATAPPRSRPEETIDVLGALLPALLLPVLGTVILGSGFGVGCLVAGAVAGLVIWRRPAWLDRLRWPPSLEALDTPWRLGRTVLLAVVALCLAGAVLALTFASSRIEENPEPRTAAPAPAAPAPAQSSRPANHGPFTRTELRTAARRQQAARARARRVRRERRARQARRARREAAAAAAAAPPAPPPAP